MRGPTTSLRKAIAAQRHLTASTISRNRATIEVTPALAPSLPGVVCATAVSRTSLAIVCPSGTTAIATVTGVAPSSISFEVQFNVVTNPFDVGVKGVAEFPGGRAVQLIPAAALSARKNTGAKGHRGSESDPIHNDDRDRRCQRRISCMRKLKKFFLVF